MSDEDMWEDERKKYLKEGTRFATYEGVPMIEDDEQVMTIWVSQEYDGSEWIDLEYHDDESDAVDYAMQHSEDHDIEYVGGKVRDDIEFKVEDSKEEQEYRDAERNAGDESYYDNNQLKNRYLQNEDDNFHTRNYLMLALVYGTHGQIDRTLNIVIRKRQQGYLDEEDNKWLYENINPYYDYIR